MFDFDFVFILVNLFIFVSNLTINCFHIKSVWLFLLAI